MAANGKPTVDVFPRADKKFWYLKYKDPATGTYRWESTGLPKTDKHKREAERMAIAKESELAKLRPVQDDDWFAFTADYLKTGLATNPESTRRVYRSILQGFADTTGVQRVSDVDVRVLREYEIAMRKKVKPSTVAKHQRHIKAALKWAKRYKYIVELPEFERIENIQTPKGKPPTTEQFELIRNAVPLYYGEVYGTLGAGLEFALDCLWWGGLRLGDLLKLTWDDPKYHRVQEIDSENCGLVMRGELAKGRRHIRSTIAPDFARLLRSVPSEERHGFVVDVRGKRGDRVPENRVSKMISKLRELAGVTVNEEGKPASAHDLRRAFGAWWSRRVMPAVLMGMMHHRDINTTLKFYVDQEAEANQQALWAAESSYSDGYSPKRQNTKTPQNKGRARSSAVRAGDS